jgi:rhamnulokinase
MSVTPRDLRALDLRALVAIDLGAESCRVSLLRWHGERPCVTLVHRFRNEAVHVCDELHWQIKLIFDQLLIGLRKCAEIATEGIRSIAVDGWAVDYVRLDENGIALADPFCYRDQRTVAAEEKAHALISAARMREITGIQLGRINTAYQLVAEKLHLQNRPWLNLPEYILHRLGAAPVAERTNASHSQLLDLDGKWSEEIFSALELDIRLAPQIVPAGTDIGQLQGPLTELAAFKDTRLIAPACHDTASAIAGIGDPADDWAYISSGTWSLVGALLDAPVHTAESSAANFTNLAAAEGKVLFHKGVNGLWLLRQCMDTWCAEGATLTIPEVVAAAEAVPPPAHLIDVDDADLLLQGEMPTRINAQLRRRCLPELDPSPANAAAIASLIFHSLAARYAEVLRLIESLSGRHFKHLHIVGGGSQNALLNRLTEQATGLSIKGTEAESSTLGNFAIQLATLESGSGSHGNSTVSDWATRLKSASRASA